MGLNLGFTTSLTQRGQPEILRLNSVPFAYSEDDKDSWLRPDAETKLVFAQSSAVPSAIPEDLEKEILHLDVLKFHLEELRNEIRKQEATIMSIWKSEFSKCSSIKCYFQTALEKAPVLAHLIANHFRHHSHVDVDFFHNGTHVNCSKDHEQLLTQPDDSEFGHDEIEESTQVGDPDRANAAPRPSISPVRSVDVAMPTPPSPPISPEQTDAPQPPSPADLPDSPPSWPWGNGSPPWGKGPPPWGKGPPPWAKPGHGPPPWFKPGMSPPWNNHDHPRPPLNPQTHDSQQFVPTLTAQQIWRIHLIGAMVGLLVVILFTACVFTCIKHRSRILRNPRCRAEIMALREEWLTKRAYRKAACKHRLRTFIRSLWFTKKSDDEEKEAILAGQDDVVVNREISNLRAAHRLVGDMMRAEEGESRFTAPISPTRSRSESLPSYTSAPPGYASGQEGDISVIDGFTGYTPSNSDDTAESSVIDCSPRISFETQRTS